MPAIGRIGAYRFFFYSNEGREPPHIHVQRERALAELWLVEVRLAGAVGFRAAELRDVERAVRRNRERFLEAWNEHFAG